MSLYRISATLKNGTAEIVYGATQGEKNAHDHERESRLFDEERDVDWFVFQKSAGQETCAKNVHGV